jgi:hypothetical protein
LGDKENEEEIEKLDKVIYPQGLARYFYNGINPISLNFVYGDGINSMATIIVCCLWRWNKFHGNHIDCSYSHGINSMATRSVVPIPME